MLPELPTGVMLDETRTFPLAVRVAAELSGGGTSATASTSCPERRSAKFDRKDLAAL